MQNANINEVSDFLQKQLKEIESSIKFEEIGKVLQVSDGVVRIWGLSTVEIGELIQFDNGDLAVVMDLEPDNVGAILLGETSKIREKDIVHRTKKMASIPMGYGMIGRVVNPLGHPLDGGGTINGDLINMPLERKAPGVIYRCPIVEPFQTGIKAIDTMIPIGKGQRELIIGDRQTGKTAICIDTIINQKINYDTGNPVYCIYVAIGQKASTVANIINILKKYGALNYTIVIIATASDNAAMQFYAPFAGAAVGEFFRDSGAHALTIYDDLSKHAVAYREISLILRRPPGREAYPGDIFYLHSRLLERSGKIINNNSVAALMNDLPNNLKKIVKGGGSLTSLPIIETQEGDISAYIPTNVISITDGQIFLDTELFNAGIHPAINISTSVSRVGGNAQNKAMKQVVGTLKIDIAQYYELEVFTKFGGDVNQITYDIIDKGRKNIELLSQQQYNPLPVENEIAIIYIGIKGLLSNIPIKNVRNFEMEFFNILEIKYRKDILDILKQGILNKEIEKKLKAIAIEIAKNYM